MHPNQDGGGACSTAAAETDGGDRSRPADSEVVAMHNNSVDCYRGLYKNMCASTIVDFTPLGDNAAFAALRLGLPYLGIAFNETHMEFLRERLVARMFQALTDPDSEFFEQAGFNFGRGVGRG